MPHIYDCIVIGAGIAGTATALVLARLGFGVFVVEEGTHPRFAIGESLVPSTTLGFDYLSRVYDVPELRQISHYPELKALGCVAWPKMGFWFAHQQVGRPLQLGHEAMLMTPGLPIGPDVHMLRSDVDAFLASRLGAYGVTYQDRTTVTDFQADAAGVTLALARGGAGGKETVRGRFVVDCSGHKSFLAAKLGLRDTPSALRTNTRTILSHFTDVPYLDELLEGPAFPISRDACTVHHCFEGGWCWVIRFDNGTTSVGLVLDRSCYPDNNLPAEEEFRSLVGRFPTLAAQMQPARPIRPFVKTGRIQFSSRALVSDRYLLAPHAAGFVDPLFSTGIDLTVAFIARMTPVLGQMLRDDVFAAERLHALEQCYLAELDSIDRVVHGIYLSFRHADVFKQYWRAWIYTSLLQYFTQTTYDPADGVGLLGHFGATLPSWQTQLDQMYRCVAAPNEDAQATATKLKALMDDFKEPFDRQHTNWTIGSPNVCCPAYFDPPGTGEKWFQNQLTENPTLQASTKLERLTEAQQRRRAASDQLARRYLQSRREGTPYHAGVDLIRSFQYRS